MKISSQTIVKGICYPLYHLHTYKYLSWVAYNKSAVFELNECMDDIVIDFSKAERFVQ